MNHLSLIMIGFGNVGRALARLLLRKRELLQAEYGVALQVNGIATGRRGSAIDPRGLDLERALALVESGASLDALSLHPAPRDGVEFIRACPADALFENSPLNVETGQPAILHLQTALEMGMHAITANKGPVVHGYAGLNELARQKGRRFLFESTVMDGAPIFSLFRGPLPAAELRGFHGILNSTTNLILERMENGSSFADAVVFTQKAGLAETDPSHDIDGWDASVKVAALATVLMGAPLKPQQVQRRGIREITPGMIAEAQQAGERWKLVCEARREGAGVVGSVAPRRVAPGSPLYSIGGSSSYVQFELDVLPGLGILESNPGPETTAYGLLADLLNAVRGM
jgi:homoserine dehydrogenase